MLKYIVIILVAVMITGCTFTLDGLKVNDGEKKISLKHVDGSDE